MMGHKICFYGEILLIIPKLSLLSPLIWSTASGLYVLVKKIESDEHYAVRGAILYVDRSC